MSYKVGDVIKKQSVIRRITSVRKTGYSWQYVDIPNKIFYSENSNDPFFEVGWSKVS